MARKRSRRKSSRRYIVLRAKGKPTVRMRKGALHRRLGIPQGKRIPKTLVKRLLSAKVGSTITNPTKTGRKRIRVDGRLKKQVVAGFRGILAAGRRTAGRL